ncbi:MAG: preprotein translocase subunit SecG [Chloroflexi bacterium]|nr:preprotein translocase subunit SecG [Chloroflexota bacterium]
METYFNVAQIIVAVVLVGVLLLQVRGGGLGGIFGQADTTFRARRGMEKTLYQFTIALVVVFIILAILNIRLS